MSKPHEQGASNPPKDPETITQDTNGDGPEKSDDIENKVNVPENIKIKVEDDVEMIESIDKPIVIDDDDDDMTGKNANIVNASDVKNINISTEGIDMACPARDGETRAPDVSCSTNDGEKEALNNSSQAKSGETSAPDFIPIATEKETNSNNSNNIDHEIDISKILKVHNEVSINYIASRQLCRVVDPDDLMSLLDPETRYRLSKMKAYTYKVCTRQHYAEIVRLMGVEKNSDVLVNKLWNNSSIITNPLMRFWPTYYDWRYNEAANLCKVLYVRVPITWGAAHIQALLDAAATNFDSRARQIKMFMKRTSLSKQVKNQGLGVLAHDNFYSEALIRFQSRKECAMVHDQLKRVKLTFPKFEVGYDSGYKMSLSTKIFRKKFDKLDPYSSAILENIDKCRKQLILENKLAGILKEFLKNKPMYAIPNNAIPNNAMVNAEVITDSNEKDDRNTSAVETGESEEQEQSTVMTCIQLADESDENHCRIIRISNLKKIEMIKNFNRAEGWNVIDVKQVGENEAVAICQTHEEAMAVVKEMNGRVVDGCTIEVQLDVGHVASRRRIQPDNEIISDSDDSNLPKYKDPRMTVFSMSRVCQKSRSPRKDDYDLRMSFFSDSLRTPYTNCVVVKNLHPEITVNQVREIFALAGVVKEIKTETDHTKILYDHPLEAVQAISMFNNQIIFNQIVQVNMETTNTPKLLPFGLQSVGPGLGKSGEPLSNLGATADTREIKKALSDRCKIEKVYRLEGPFVFDYEVTSTPLTANKRQQTVRDLPNWPNAPVRPNRPNVPVRPNRPNVPVWDNVPNVPVRPNWPNAPVRPNRPNVPVRPNRPNVPVRPNRPNVPVRPNRPNVPVWPNVPNVPVRLIVPIVPNVRMDYSLSSPMAQTAQSIPTTPVQPVNHAPNIHWDAAYNASAAYCPPENTNHIPQPPPPHLPQPIYQYSQNPVSYLENPVPQPLPPPPSTFASPSTVPNNPNPISVPYQPNISHNYSPVLTNPGNKNGRPEAAVVPDQNTVPQPLPPPPPTFASPCAVPNNPNPISVPYQPNISHNYSPVLTNPGNKNGRPEAAVVPDQNTVPQPLPPPPPTFASPCAVPNNPNPKSVPYQPNISHNYSPVPTNPGKKNGRPEATVVPDQNIRKRKYDEIARGLLSFSNLPTCVTVDDLRKKVMEIGDVGLCEVTGKGRAIVRFKNPKDAERCISLFHRSKVNGQILDVNYV